MKRSHVILGSGLIVLGVLFLLDGLGAIDFGAWWPLLLIFFGAWLLFTRVRSQRSVSAPGVGEEASSPEGPARQTAPSAPPASEVPQAASPALEGALTTSPTPGLIPPYRPVDLDRFSIFSEFTDRVVASFRWGKAVVVFGQGNIDLTQATIPSEGAVLDVTAVFGAINVYPPNNCRVVVDGSAVLGTFQAKTGPSIRVNIGPDLRIQGAAVLGSVDVFG